MFTVGQKVVALKSWKEVNVFEGNVYTVTEVGFCCKFYITIGILLPKKYNRARHDECGKILSHKYRAFAAKHFAPLEDIEAMNEFFNEITQPETIQV